MDDIELKSIQLQFPRRFSDGACQEVRVHTDRGDIMVAVRGERTKPAILTYHDMGLNCKYTNFLLVIFGSKINKSLIYANKNTAITLRGYLNADNR